MIYGSSSFFYYKSDNIEELDSLTLFHDATCEDMSYISTYNNLLENEEIENAVEYINTSTMHTYNASLFNRLVSMINKTQKYYVENYWDSENSDWIDKDSLHAYTDTGLIGNSQIWLCPSEMDVSIDKATLLRKNMWIDGEYTSQFFGEYFNYVPTGAGEFPIKNDATTENCFSYDDIIRLTKGKYKIDTNISDSSLYITISIYSNAVYEDVWNENSSVEQGYSDIPAVEPLEIKRFYSNEDGTFDLTTLITEDGVEDTDIFWMTISFNIDSATTVSRETLLKMFSPKGIFITLTQL